MKKYWLNKLRLQKENCFPPASTVSTVTHFSAEMLNEMQKFEVRLRFLKRKKDSYCFSLKSFFKSTLKNLCKKRLLLIEIDANKTVCGSIGVALK